MTRRSFFSMFTAAIVSVVGAVKVKPHWSDIGRWPINFAEMHFGRLPPHVEAKLQRMLRRYPAFSNQEALTYIAKFLRSDMPPHLVEKKYWI